MRRAFALTITLALTPAAALADDDPGVLQLAPGHGRPQAFFLSGRLIEDEGQGKGRPNASRLRNLVQAVQQLESDEVEGAVIEVRVGPHTYRRTTDDEGRFLVFEEALDPPLPVGILQAQVKVLKAHGHPTPPATVPLQVLPDAPGIAVISDIDDTIMVSNVSSKRALVANTLLRNARQIPAVPGVGIAYRAAREAGALVFFYLSGSPQNLLPRMLEFIDHQALPSGPVLLKDFGTDRLFDQAGYKVARIQQLLAIHPKLRFILVGDSGEADPEIYARIKGQYPGRIVGIVIRKVPARADPPERFAGMTAVDHFSQDPEVLARLIRKGIQ